MGNVLIILFGTLLVLLCVIGVWACVTTLHLKKAKNTSHKSENNTGDACEGVIIFNNSSYSFVRTYDGRLYVLHESKFDVGEKITIITVDNIRGKQVSNSLKTTKRMISPESELKAEVLSRLSENLLLCSIIDNNSIIEVPSAKLILVEATVKEQEVYAEKIAETITPKLLFWIEYKAEAPSLIPVSVKEFEVKIPECLQKEGV